MGWSLWGRKLVSGFALLPWATKAQYLDNNYGQCLQGNLHCLFTVKSEVQVLRSCWAGSI